MHKDSDECLMYVTQNHRMFGVGRDLCGSSSPTPLLKQGHLQQAAHNLVQVGLEYLLVYCKYFKRVWVFCKLSHISQIVHVP